METQEKPSYRLITAWPVPSPETDEHAARHGLKIPFAAPPMGLKMVHERTCGIRGCLCLVDDERLIQYAQALFAGETPMYICLVCVRCVRANAHELLI